MQRVTPGASMKRVLASIRGVTADGGTDVYRGSRRAWIELLASQSPNRHLILLTDGISQEHDYSALLARLKRNRIAVATVALGTDVDAALLRRISKATGGNAYATKLAGDLPKIFVKETRLSAEPIQIVGAQQVLPRGTSPVVRSLAGAELPPLTGNVVTRLRPGAQVDLIARSANARTEPALAQWGYGSGRVVSWTPGLGAPWATRWTAQTALWNDAVRWAARGVPPEPAAVTARVGTAMALEVDLAAAGPTPATRLTASLERPGAADLRVVLEENAPSVYTAELPVLPVGSYPLTLALPTALAAGRGACASTFRTRPSTCRRRSDARRSGSLPSRRAAACSRRTIRARSRATRARCACRCSSSRSRSSWLPSRRVCSRAGTSGDR